LGSLDGSVGVAEAIGVVVGAGVGESVIVGVGVVVGDGVMVAVCVGVKVALGGRVGVLLGAGLAVGTTVETSDITLGTSDTGRVAANDVCSAAAWQPASTMTNRRSVQRSMAYSKIIGR
jgi:hypothetical protein